MKRKLILLIFVILAAFSIGTIYASETIDVTTSDSFYFYSTDSLAANDGYYAAVSVDGTPYYLDNENYDKLCNYSNSFAQGLIYQFQDTTTKQDIKMGSVKVGTLETPHNPVGDFEKSVDKEFSFKYKIGQVGLNKNAHIITSLDLDGWFKSSIFILPYFLK